MAHPERADASLGTVQSMSDDMETPTRGGHQLGWQPSRYSTSIVLSFGMSPHAVTGASSSRSGRSWAELSPFEAKPGAWQQEPAIGGSTGHEAGSPLSPSPSRHEGGSATAAGAAPSANGLEVSDTLGPAHCRQTALATTHDQRTCDVATDRRAAWKDILEWIGLRWRYFSKRMAISEHAACRGTVGVVTMLSAGGSAEGGLRLFLQHCLVQQRARKRLEAGKNCDEMGEQGLLSLSAVATMLCACSQDPVGVGGDASNSRLGALTSDAGLYATARTPNGVSCAAEGQQICSSPTSVCCGIAKFEADEAGPVADAGITTSTASFIGYDLSCASDIGACGGELNQSCDGPEDCQVGDSCCLTDGGSWYFKTACAPKCRPLGSEAPGLLAQLCHDHSDCPNDFSACCVSRGSGFSPPPFGFCIAASTVMTGDSISCDVP